MVKTIEFIFGENLEAIAKVDDKTFKLGNVKGIDAWMETDKYVRLTYFQESFKERDLKQLRLLEYQCNLIEGYVGEGWSNKKRFGCTYLLNFSSEDKVKILFN